MTATSRPTEPAGTSDFLGTLDDYTLSAGSYDAIPPQDPHPNGLYPRMDWQPAPHFSHGKKHACTNCRSRKKGCDLALPSCSLCSKHGELCTYPQPRLALPNVSPSSVIGNGPFNDQSPPAFGSRPAGNPQQSLPQWLDVSSPDLLPPWDLRPELGSYAENNSQTWPTARDHAQKQPRQIRRDFQESIGDTRSSISGGNFSPARTPASQPPQKIAQSIQRMEGRGEAPSQPDVEEHLPLQAEVFRLTDLFFAKHHLHLPCLHRKRVLNHIENNLESTGDSGLVLVIIAVAASTHQEIDVRARGQRWLARARGLLERELDRCSPYVSTMQVSVWIVFLLYVTGEHLQAWMLLSRIYHLASAMGYNQIDRPGNSMNLPSVGTDLEREEFRKALWALYILDRSISCLLFVPLVIDDRYLFVNFPVQEEYFQSHSDANFDSLDCSCSPFTTDLSVLIGPYILQNPGSMPNVGHIYRASVLLGRIVDLHKQPHVPRHSREHIEHISNLERILSLFDFALSKPNQCSQAMEPSAVLFSLWLSTLVQTCNILLWHPHASSAQPTSKDIGTYHNGHPPRERCSVAAKSILRDLRARQAHLLASSNPFLLCACFLSCHLTVIGSHYEEKNCRDDVEFLLDMVKRMGMNGYLLGQKLHRKMNSDVRRKPEEMQDLANGCGYYIDHRHSP